MNKTKCNQKCLVSFIFIFIIIFFSNFSRFAYPDHDFILVLVLWPHFQHYFNKGNFDEMLQSAPELHYEQSLNIRVLIFDSH